ncbi:MAG: FliO/MopB family protein [Proteobacteria bacterium]|nr:FliO/MopB family protein [Pseudomonadota bacterium]MCH8187596.1 FliO/MopB family protein [Pseudomonadota bacterium]
MEFGTIFRFVVALVFVLGLIGVLAVVAKRAGLSPRVSRSVPGTNKRLSIVEVMAIDAKRRLVLIRRDDREHLVLLGADRDLVVESNVVPPAKPSHENPPDTGADVGSFLDLAKRGRRQPRREGNDIV